MSCEPSAPSLQEINNYHNTQYYQVPYQVAYQMPCQVPQQQSCQELTQLQQQLSYQLPQYYENCCDRPCTINKPTVCHKEHAPITCCHIL